jgi:hypothetical protein
MEAPEPRGGIMTRPSFATIARPSFAVFLVAAAAVSTAHAQSAPLPLPAQAPVQSATPASPQPPPKKVWTNDDVSGSHEQPDNSVASNRPGPNSSANSSAKNKSRKDAKWYHDQIAKLQSQIPPLDRSIAELQAVLEGKTVNAPPHYGGNRIGDWKDQLQQLEKKRQDALDKISSLEDEARHNGVSPNALP